MLVLLTFTSYLARRRLIERKVKDGVGAVDRYEQCHEPVHKVSHVSSLSGMCRHSRDTDHRD
jgi:hypothetical protein